MKSLGHFLREDSTVEVLRPVSPLCFWTDPNREQDNSVQPSRRLRSTSRSSSSELLEKSVGGSGIESPSPCETGRRAHSMLGYSIVLFFFLLKPPEAGGTTQKYSHQSDSQSPFKSWAQKMALPFFRYEATWEELLQKCDNIRVGPSLCPGRLLCNQNTNDMLS
ncbi:hypothetical protein AVEN_5965-1 [Araneus ventricosus]|uniref:Uncharacterized protein n=1 Tax=Araneus ventricosus TaxID=182803 RepID=A0A4Y2CL48_ARAVE|nr:hypothetical protein AVEN_5965-1 [Araneus ventricosus]